MRLLQLAAMIGIVTRTVGDVHPAQLDFILRRHGDVGMGLEIVVATVARPVANAAW